jgi:hypothetical protein
MATYSVTDMYSQQGEGRETDEEFALTFSYLLNIDIKLEESLLFLTLRKVLAPDAQSFVFVLTQFQNTVISKLFRLSLMNILINCVFVFVVLIRLENLYFEG